MLVSGHPGSGKSTLAMRLAASTGWPVVSKDGLKEILFDQLGIGDRDWSRWLGRASWALMEHVLEVVMQGGAPAIAEGNFGPPAGAMVRRLVERHRYRSAEIWCDAPADLLVERFHARVQSANRHPGHRDEANLDEQWARVARSYEPVSVTAVLKLDTTVSADRAAALAVDWLQQAFST